MVLSGPTALFQVLQMAQKIFLLTGQLQTRGVDRKEKFILISSRIKSNMQLRLLDNIYQPFSMVNIYSLSENATWNIQLNALWPHCEMHDF